MDILRVLPHSYCGTFKDLLLSTPKALLVGNSELLVRYTSNGIQGFKLPNRDIAEKDDLGTDITDTRGTDWTEPQQDFRPPNK